MLASFQNLACLSNGISHFSQLYFHLTTSTQLCNCMRFNKLNFTTWLKVEDRITYLQIKRHPKTLHNGFLAFSNYP
jgi:hypothetical protein